jgi:hypothetical protein
MLEPPLERFDVLNFDKPAAGYVDLIVEGCLAAANCGSAGCLAAAHGGSAGCLAAAYTGPAGWPAVSDASNKALFQRVELDPPSFRLGSPFLDSGPHF